jgi:hypothetical protein
MYVALGRGLGAFKEATKLAEYFVKTHKQLHTKGLS